MFKKRKEIKTILLAAAALLIWPMTSNANSLGDYINQFVANGQYIAEIIDYNGRKYNIDPLFLASIFYVESRYDNAAVSSAGAKGVAQLMPDTANYLNVDPNNIEGNIEGGSRYFKEMLDLHQNKGIQQYNFALASYNAGPGNATNTIPTYTYDYINMVNQEYLKLQKIIDPSIITRTSNTNKKEQLLLLYKLKKYKNLIKKK